MNLTTTCGEVINGVTIAKPNADFQPWFGFSSEGLSLSYARANDSTTEDLAGLDHARIFTSGNFEDHNRKIEIAIAWADVAADVATNVQPGGNIASNLAPGLQFESEPLLVYHDYNSQSFIGAGNKFAPPSGLDSNSVNVQLGPATVGATDTNFLGQVLNAAYAPGLAVNGTGDAWSNLASSTLYMDTSANNTSGVNPGNLGVDIRYAWDYTNLYILVAEDTNFVTPVLDIEAPSESAYLSGAYLCDTIAFWVNLTTTCGNTYDGVTVVKANADFQPWFGFSSSNLSLFWGRANDSTATDLAGLAHARIFTSGNFAAHNRKIEAAIVWADIAADVAATMQPGGNIASNLAPGLEFESEPLLIYDNYNSQSFIGAGNVFNVPSGADINSVNVQLGPTGLAVTSGFPTNTPSAFVAAGQFHLNLTGTAGSSFRLWSTTNLALHPVTNTWTLVSSGAFSVARTASITDAQATNAAKFYVITEP